MENVRKLVERLKRDDYRSRLIRRKYISKGNGKAVAPEKACIHRFSRFFNMIYYKYDLENAFLRVLLYPIVDTKWKPGFLEEKFSNIKISMTKEEVFKIIGKPFFIGEPPSTYSSYWAYTWDKNESDSAYDVRMIYFNNSDTVDRVERCIR